MCNRFAPAAAIAAMLATPFLWAAGSGIQGGQKLQAQPAVKLDPKVQNAITEPAAKVEPKIESAPKPEPKVKIKPETQKALTKPPAAPQPSKKLDTATAKPPAPGTAPDGPAALPGSGSPGARLPAVQAPAIAVENARTAAEAARAAEIASQIRQLEQLRQQQQARNPALGTGAADPAAGTALEGLGPDSAVDGSYAHETARDLLGIGRGASLGDIEKGFHGDAAMPSAPAGSGAPTAGGSAPNPGGIASYDYNYTDADGNRHEGGTGYWSSSPARKFSVERITRPEGTTSVTTMRYDEKGRLVSIRNTERDEEGNVVSTYQESISYDNKDEEPEITGWVDPDTTDDEPPQPLGAGGSTAGGTAGGVGGSTESQPREDPAGSIAGNDGCVWMPMQGCIDPRNVPESVRQMTGQPSEGGDDGTSESSTPNVGPIAVTNPDEFHSGGGGSGGGFNPPGGTPVNPDPPEGGGPGAPPAGPAGVAAGDGSVQGAASLEGADLDAAMEALEAPVE